MRHMNTKVVYLFSPQHLCQFLPLQRIVEQCSTSRSLSLFHQQQRVLPHLPHQVHLRVSSGRHHAGADHSPTDCWDGILLLLGLVEVGVDGLPQQVVLLLYLLIRFLGSNTANTLSVVRGNMSQLHRSH